MSRDEVIVKGRILRWGNSYGIRLRRAELKKVGLSPGSEAIVRMAKEHSRVDLSGLPAFKGGGPDDSVQHDELLGRSRAAAMRERKR